MITYATRDDILFTTTSDTVIDAIGRRIILSGERNESRYGVIDSGNARGLVVRVDYVGDSAKPGVVRVKIHFGQDDNRADDTVNFGREGYIMGRATSNTMGVQAPGQCDCGEFHSSH